MSKKVLVVLVVLVMLVGGNFTREMPVASAQSADCNNLLNDYFPGIALPAFGIFPVTVAKGERVTISNDVLSGSGTHLLELSDGTVLEGPKSLDDTLVYTFPADGFYDLRIILTGSGSVDITFSCGIPAAGCDVLMPIPATAVGGSFVADAPVYWKPGELTQPLVTIKAGNTARVTRADDTGAYYEIIWHCQFLWVPANTLVSNTDAVWQGAPLPARPNAYGAAQTSQGVTSSAGGVGTGSAAGYPVYSAPKTANSYTVQRGDNLFRIAMHFGVDMYALASVNGIANIQQISVGQILNIAAAR